MISPRERIGLRGKRDDVDVHGDIHTNVHIPGHGVAKAHHLERAIVSDRAVKVGEAEALDVSGAVPLRLENEAVDTMETAGPYGPAWMPVCPRTN